MALSPYHSEPIVVLKTAYNGRKGIIEDRIMEFERFLDRDEEDIFAELCFCICTPQSKARACDWAINRMKETGTLFGGRKEDIALELRGVRFRQNKAMYIVTAREQFSREGNIQIKRMLSGHLDAQRLREWIVKNVKGLGYKEASHFLRNIGIGLDMAILDRHILKNLRRAGVIETIPAFLSREKYLEIERKMRTFAEKIGIPLMHLDLVLWSQETGEVFR